MAKIAKISQFLPPATLPRPPAHLSAASKKWWRETIAEFAMGPSDLRLLAQAAEAFDEAESARAILAKSGLVFTDERGNVRAHPCVAIARDARALHARLLKALRLDGPQQPAPGPIGRPPGITSPRMVVRKDDR